MMDESRKQTFFMTAPG